MNIASASTREHEIIQSLTSVEPKLPRVARLTLDLA